ncbi:MAG: hypothetical protein WCY48_02775 [Candidatus Caldatribacteriota bacterium]
MRFHHTIIFFMLSVFSLSSFAYELVIIQAVSNTGKTFITRNGKRQGVQPGHTATFTAENVSILARAKTVTGNFTHWELVNPALNMPFTKGEIVTLYPAKEYLWALAPEKVREQYIRTQIPPQRKSFVFKGTFGRGISESVSDAPANAATRGMIGAEMYYEKDLGRHFAFDIGLRFDREAINYETSSFITNRSMLVADLLYYFRMLEEYIPGKFYVALGVGVGYSSTEVETLKQSGSVAMLPGFKLGISYPFNYDWEFLIDAGVESLQTNEKQESGDSQTTTQTNFKSTIGLRRFF